MCFLTMQYTYLRRRLTGLTVKQKQVMKGKDQRKKKSNEGRVHTFFLCRVVHHADLFRQELQEAAVVVFLEEAQVPAQGGEREEERWAHMSRHAE